MKGSALAALVILASAAAGCPSRSGEEAKAPSSLESSKSAEPESAEKKRDEEPKEQEQEQDVSEDPKSAPNLEPIEGADLSPLPDSALLRYQLIRLGPGCRGNYRFVLHRDGKVFYQENGRGAECEPPQRFDAELPDKPRKTLDEAEVAQIEELIRERGFFDLEKGYREPARDGAQEILEVQLDGKTHRVVVEFVDHPDVSAIRDAVLTPLYQ